MLGVVHPHSVSDPAWIRRSNIEIRVGVCVNINLIFPLQSQLVIVDADMTKLAGDDEDVGGPRADRDDLDDGFSTRMLRCLEVSIMKKRLKHAGLASLSISVNVEILIFLSG